MGRVRSQRCKRCWGAEMRQIIVLSALVVLAAQSASDVHHLGASDPPPPLNREQVMQKSREDVAEATNAREAADAAAESANVALLDAKQAQQVADDRAALGHKAQDEVKKLLYGVSHQQANAQKVAESMRRTQGGGQEGQDKATAQAEAADTKAIQLEKKQLANAKADLVARMAKARANGEDMSQFAAGEATMKTKERGLAAKEASAPVARPKGAAFEAKEALKLEQAELANAKADLAARMVKARANGEDMSQFAAEEATMKTKQSGLAAKEATAAAHNKQATEVTDYMLDQKVASADERSAKDKEKAATDKMQSVEHRVEEQRKMTAERLQDKESAAAETVAVKEAKLKQRQLVAENKNREKANTERLDAERETMQQEQKRATDDRAKEDRVQHEQDAINTEEIKVHDLRNKASVRTEAAKKAERILRQYANRTLGRVKELRTKELEHANRVAQFKTEMATNRSLVEQKNQAVEDARFHLKAWLANMSTKVMNEANTLKDRRNEINADAAKTDNQREDMQSRIVKEEAEKEKEKQEIKDKRFQMSK